MTLSVLSELTGRSLMAVGDWILNIKENAKGKPDLVNDAILKSILKKYSGDSAEVEYTPSEIQYILTGTFGEGTALVWRMVVKAFAQLQGSRDTRLTELQDDLASLRATVEAQGKAIAYIRRPPKEVPKEASTEKPTKEFWTLADYAKSISCPYSKKQLRDLRYLIEAVAADYEWPPETVDMGTEQVPIYHHTVLKAFFNSRKDLF